MRPKRIVKYKVGSRGGIKIATSRAKLVSNHRGHAVVREKQTQKAQATYEALMKAHATALRDTEEYGEKVITARKYKLEPVKHLDETRTHTTTQYIDNPTVQELQIAASGKISRLPKDRRETVRKFLRENSLRIHEVRSRLDSAFRELQANFDKIEMLSHVDYNLGIGNFAVNLRLHSKDVRVMRFPKTGKLTFTWVGEAQRDVGDTI